MSSGKTVLVSLKNGRNVRFNVTCYTDYEALVKEVGNIWFRWIVIGNVATVRRSEIAGIFYSEGANANSQDQEREAREGGEASIDDEV